MLHSLIQNEAGLKLAVSYPEFPGNHCMMPAESVLLRKHADKESRRLWRIHWHGEGYQELHPAPLRCKFAMLFELLACVAAIAMALMKGNS